MTAPTHIAFGVLIAACAGAPYTCGAACGLGALLPDLDHPQSALGRVFFFISQPLNARFGHRGMVHGLVMWLPLLIVGLLLKSPVTYWLALGALSHIAIDALNVSGVRALEPYSQKPVVCFKRDWRIITGSVKEFVLLGVLTVLIFSMNYAQSIGGPRRIINLILHSPRITAEEYLRAGLKYCRVAGSFRWQDGRIEDVDWPVIGPEGAHLVYWTGEELVRNSKDGEFLRSVLRQHENSWSIVQVKGLQKVSTECFWLDEKGKWHYSKPGDLATGTIKTAPGEIQSLEPATDPLHSITLDGWADNLFSTAENDVAGRKEVTAR